ncbi:glycosyltransferase [Chloroflexota bacterium]
MPADVINIDYLLSLNFLGPLYRASDGVLANSGFEPFGIVGLETMAVGGVAYTGCTGEDYAIPYVNSFVLETSDPMEIVSHATHLRNFPEEEIRIRKAAKHTARQFTWEATVRNLISKLENQARAQDILKGRTEPAPLPLFELDQPL